MKKNVLLIILLFIVSTTIQVSAYQTQSVNIQPEKHCACHDGAVAPYVITHSNITSNYGEWSIKCYTCHTIHHNEQVTSYGNEGYVFQGTSTDVTGTTLSKTSAGWIADQYRGYVLIANTAINSSLYKIIGNTANTLYIEGSLNLDEVKNGDTFAIIYGKMIRTTITTPNNGTKGVKFFDPEGMNSFADGDTTFDGICEVCHSKTTHFRNDGTAPDQSHTSMGNVVGKKCTTCHQHVNGFKGMGGGAHDAHVTANYGPRISCSNCHGTQPVPLLADGKNLENTTVCDTCHSPGGSYDGVNDVDVGAKNNWNGIYNSADNSLKAGKEKWCIGCHDSDPAVVNGEIAPNKAGDNVTFGYYVTGHGKVSNYSRMSWQDFSANGNPGANESCDKCHDSTSNHIVPGPNSGSRRLKSGYQNDQNNTNCNNCHKPGGEATSNPLFYTDPNSYEASVHGGKNCTECHDVHGTAGPYKAMTKGEKQGLCLTCHTSHQGHALGRQFVKDGKTYSLECTSCHNVHIITGNYTVEDPNKSPVTKLSNITEVWGDEPGEKMKDYAGSGTYRTPNGDTFNGSQLPDYVTFCLDCHGVPQGEFGPHGGISWGSDEPHGLNSANEPNGYGTCPNWFACGKAGGWEDDTCIGDEATCWPVLPRGLGDQLFSRSAYDHKDRIAGANFVLSCTDCHVTHESGTGSKLRPTVNGGPGSTIWNTMCNDCHYYYSDWHAGMSCGSASCHVSARMSSTGVATLHNMSSRTGSGGTRTFNPYLVADMKFENNLKDSGSFQMDGRWYSQYAEGGTGSFVSGRSGQAIQVNGNQPVELGSENDKWSTDAGYHGTWVYSEMKKNMTLEAWVYPTSNQANGENHIISKHTYNDGGYTLLLKSVGGTLRVALLTNVNGGEVVWNSPDCNGLRGAFSSVPVQLNEWTHIAAVFDPDLPDRDLNNGSMGRIRIYVNGEDVTTSYPASSQCYAQPAAGETDMFPYSEMNIKNESRCYDGQWCASALSIGGLMWGDGARKGLIGKIDEVKVWNTVKQQAYYDQLIPPKIRKVEGAAGRNYVIVTFNDGVYTNTGKSGALQAIDFTLSDTDNSRTILDVNHIAGEKTVNITLSSPLDDINDMNVDTIAAKSNSIYDSYNNPAGTDPVKITCNCVTGPIKSAIFQLNEPANSANATDESGSLNGTVNNTSETFPGDGFYHGNGISNYIDFENNDTSLQASTLLTIETRIKPTGLEGTGDYIRRIFARDGSGNYQISIWRNNAVFAPYYNAPGGVASIAFWLRPVDNHGGNTWKPVMTNYSSYPIVSDHWYKVKLVWNSSITGGIPGSIFVDDQGTDGNGVSENWIGYVDATDASQSQLPAASKLYESDIIYGADGDFVIGGNVNPPHTNNVFKGLIDWISISTI